MEKYTLKIEHSGGAITVTLLDKKTGQQIYKLDADSWQLKQQHEGDKFSAELDVDTIDFFIAHYRAGNI